MKVGVIGAGAISRRYLQNMIYKFDNLDVAAIANRHPDKALKRAEEFHIPACSIEELLANPEIEMVVNLTPVEAHYEIIRQALEAGKHVYTEKTITNDAAKARELLALADAKGLYLGSAPDTFLGSAFQAAKSAVEDGLLGEIHSFSMSANRNNDFLISRFSYLRASETGILFDYGVYYLTALVNLLGPVSRVCGITQSPYTTRRGVIPGLPEYGKEILSPAESIVSAVLQLRNGMTGTLHIDAESNGYDQAYFAIFGTKGILYLSDPNMFGGEVKFLPCDMDPAHPVKPVVLWQFTPYSENSRGIGPSEMARAIEEGVPNRASKEVAGHVLEVLEGILKSSRSGGFVSITSDCTIPQPLPQEKVPVTNIGHINLRLNNDEAMLQFYTEVLGMQDLFTLTRDDLIIATEEQYGKEAVASLKERFPVGSAIPWIRYLKLSDHRFLELTLSEGKEFKALGERREYYGFQKVSYETDDLDTVYRRVEEAGAVIKDPLHDEIDGARAFSVLDPDGNVVEIIRYMPETGIPASDVPDITPCSPFKYTTQVTYQVQDAINMENFYCKGLGFQKVRTFTYGDLADYLESGASADKNTIMKLRAIKERPYADYLEAAPHQYIKLIHAAGEAGKEVRDLTGFRGFQHICFEVEDIHKAMQAVISNGIKPDSEISLGADRALQFWITDPDGNRIEMMSYTKDSRELQ